MNFVYLTPDEAKGFKPKVIITSEKNGIKEIL
jgi:aspartate 1-decarboxylase